MSGSSFPSEIHIRLTVFILSLVGLVISLFFILSPIPAPVVAQYWRPSSIVLLGILAALSAAAFFVRRGAFVLVILLIRISIITMTLRPFGPALAIKLPLWATVPLESGGMLALPGALLVMAVFLCVVLLTQGPLLVWGETFVPPPSPAELWMTLVFLACLAALAILLRAASAVVRRNAEQNTRLDEAVRQLTVANLSFQKLASSAEERSADDERKRITREIHDSIGYALNNLIMMMEAAIRLSPKENAGLRTLLSQAREEAQVGLNETRKALRLQRGVTTEQVRGLSAIHRLVTIFSSATGVEVRVDYCNARQSYGDDVDLVVYRMIQEGMTNAFRHGHATLMRLRFWQEESGLRVMLWDNGAASPSMQEGIGLSGMRERLESIGGSLSAARMADGFELAAWLPLAAPENAEPRAAAQDAGGSE